MAVNTKVMFGFTTVALVVGIVLVMARGHTSPAKHQPQASAAGPGASPRASSAQPAPPPPASVAPAKPAPGAGPPSFTTPAAADPPGCEEKLAKVRGLADRYSPASPAHFERAKPSSKNQAELAPIIDRAIGRLTGRGGYQLECRAAVCRVGALGAPEATRLSPPWVTALLGDTAFRSSVGPRELRVARIETTKDALTGATLHQQWIYFGVPRAPDEEHPFEAAADVNTCGERVAALEKALDEPREKHRRIKEQEQERQRRLAQLPVNPELARRVQAALRPFISDATGATAGVWECRGASACRWRGPAPLLHTFFAFKRSSIDGALAAQGLTAEQITPNDPKNPENEAELSLVLSEAKKGRARAGGP
jgi:hypothetical protein